MGMKIIPVDITSLVVLLIYFAHNRPSLRGGSFKVLELNVPIDPGRTKKILAVPFELENSSLLTTKREKES